MSLRQFIEVANEYRDSPMVELLVAGKVTRSINVDGTVVQRLGQVGGIPTYRISCRIFEITDGGGIKITDDHEDWFDAGNEEVETIKPKDVIMVVVANPQNEDFSTDEGNVLTFANQ